MDDSLVRSYCLSGSFALIYSQGANRFGFVPRSALVNEAQSANCFNGGTAGEVDDDADTNAQTGFIRSSAFDSIPPTLQTC